MRRCLIAYDITDNRIRYKVARLLEKHGSRIQRSVFLVETGEAALRRLEANLTELLEESDNLLLLPCCDACFARAVMAGPPPPVEMVA